MACAAAQSSFTLDVILLDASGEPLCSSLYPGLISVVKCMPCESRVHATLIVVGRISSHFTPDIVRTEICLNQLLKKKKKV